MAIRVHPILNLMHDSHFTNFHQILKDLVRHFPCRTYETRALEIGLFLFQETMEERGESRICYRSDAPNERSYEKTDLHKSVKIFQNFIQSIEKEIKLLKIKDSDDKMDF